MKRFTTIEIGATLVNELLNLGCVCFWKEQNNGNGWGPVGWAVASDTRDPRFKSSHWQILLPVNWSNTKRRIWRKKRPWLAHILSTYLPLTWNKTVFPRFNDISGLSYLITYLLIRDPRFKSSQRANFILSISTYLLGTKQYFPDSMTSVDTGILLNQISTNQSGTTCPADCQTT